MANSKGQQEIIGFVLIIIIVIVIFLVYLSFSIGRGDTNKPNSADISNLLSSLMYHSTNCTIGYDAPEELGDVIKACYRDNQICDDGNYSCGVLNDSMNEIIGKSLGIEDNSANRAYNLSIYYKIINSSARSNELNLEEGRFINCSSKPGAIYTINENNLGQGEINIELDVCKG